MTLPFETARISPRQLNRRSFIGGSDARIIMGSDEASLLRLWREKRGEAEPEDLSDNLIVQLGLVTEPLNRHWFERNTGHVITQVQRRVQHPVIRWMAATLDGMVEQTGAVFEAKFMLPWSFSEEVAAEKYMPQVQHNMWVMNAKAAVLSIITGGGKWWRSPSRPIPSISTSCSRPRKNSGAALRTASPLDCLDSSRPARGSKQCGSST
jgi:putative phage-type endonuclease